MEYDRNNEEKNEMKGKKKKKIEWKKKIKNLVIFEKYITRSFSVSFFYREKYSITRRCINKRMYGFAVRRKINDTRVAQIHNGLAVTVLEGESIKFSG